MKIIKQYKKAAVSAVEKIMDSDGVALVEKMDTLLSTQFSDVEVFQDETITAFQQVLMEGLSHVQVLERYIALHVPQMEDGNNFGVTVQLTVSKFLKDTREEWLKHLEKVPSYYSSTADALEKCATGKSTACETKTLTETSNTGGKDGDENKSSTVTVKESKTTCEDIDKAARKKHLDSLGTQSFISMKSALIDCMTSYLSILDNMEKNMSKLTSPKGSSGGNSMGMY